jgi:elongation factor P
MMWGEAIIDVALPITVEYTVVDTPPNFKGNSAQGATKPATLDAGAVVNVPMFIEIGEKIMVSTEDCKYMGRSNS